MRVCLCVSVYVYEGFYTCVWEYDCVPTCMSVVCKCVCMSMSVSMYVCVIPCVNVYT